MMLYGKENLKPSRNYTSRSFRLFILTNCQFIVMYYSAQCTHITPTNAPFCIHRDRSEKWNIVTRWNDTSCTPKIPSSSAAYNTLLAVPGYDTNYILHSTYRGGNGVILRPTRGLCDISAVSASSGFMLPLSAPPQQIESFGTSSCGSTPHVLISTASTIQYARIVNIADHMPVHQAMEDYHALVEPLYKWNINSTSTVNSSQPHSHAESPLSSTSSILSISSYKSFGCMSAVALSSSGDVYHMHSNGVERVSSLPTTTTSSSRVEYSAHPLTCFAAVSPQLYCIDFRTASATPLLPAAAATICAVHQHRTSDTHVFLATNGGMLLLDIRYTKSAVAVRSIPDARDTNVLLRSCAAPNKSSNDLLLLEGSSNSNSIFCHSVAVTPSTLYTNASGNIDWTVEGVPVVDTTWRLTGFDTCSCSRTDNSGIIDAKSDNSSINNSICIFQQVSNGDVYGQLISITNDAVTTGNLRFPIGRDYVTSSSGSGNVSEGIGNGPTIAHPPLLLNRPVPASAYPLQSYNVIPSGADASLQRYDILTLHLLHSSDLGNATLIPDKRKRKRSPTVFAALDDFWGLHAEELSRACDKYPHSLAELYCFVFKQKRAVFETSLTIQQFRDAILSHRCYFHFKELHYPLLLPSAAHRIYHKGSAVDQCACHTSQTNKCCDSTTCLLPHVLYYQPEAHVMDGIDGEISADLFLIELVEDESFLQIT